MKRLNHIAAHAEAARARADQLLEDPEMMSVSVRDVKDTALEVTSPCRPDDKDARTSFADRSAQHAPDTHNGSVEDLEMMTTSMPDAENLAREEISRCDSDDDTRTKCSAFLRTRIGRLKTMWRNKT
jgi:hypothetical protein